MNEKVEDQVPWRGMCGGEPFAAESGGGGGGQRRSGGGGDQHRATEETGVER
jgi:hypothetical protein